MASTQQQPAIMQPADPLAELRDIHQPGMIETWPPAPGWWLLVLIALLAVIAGCAWLVRRWRANRYRREARAELHKLLNDWQAHQDDQAYLTALQQLLKRTALTSFPREAVASLTGEAWLQFLDQSTGTHDFSMGVSETLIDGNYRADIEVDVPALQSAALSWINRHSPKLLQQQRMLAAEEQAA
jgi:hypothetical protein